MPSTSFKTLGMCLLLYSGTAPASERDENAIRQLYVTLARGMKTKDIRAVASTEGPNFEEVIGGKAITSEILNKQIQYQFKDTKQISRFDIKVTTLRVQGGKAYATTMFSMAATIVPFKPGDHEHHLTVIGSTSDEFVKFNGHWLFKSTKDTGSVTKMDGRAMGAKA